MRSGRGLDLYLGLRFFNLVLAFAFQIVVVKILPVEQYAIYAVLLACVMTIERLLSFGVDRTILRYVPVLVLERNWGVLRSFGLKLALLRCTTIGLALGVLLAGFLVFGSSLPGEVTPGTIVAVAAWYTGYSLFTDLEAAGQGFMIHAEAALTGTLEILARTAALAALGLSSAVNAETVILISAGTTGFACVALTGFLLINLRRQAAIRDQKAPMTGAGAKSIHGRRRHFMLAAYGSTLGWLISSPSVVRVVASSGLAVGTLAGFSFLQGIASSLQRAFPGLLILPVLEPFLARNNARGQDQEGRAALSLIFKLDLCAILSATIVVSIAGFFMVKLLSSESYAQYSDILIVFLLILTMNTIYRMFEIRAGIILKQGPFMVLWLLGIVSVTAIFLTVREWGLVSVLLWPALENIARIGTLLVVYRRDALYESLDARRTLPLLGVAALIAVAIVVPVEATYSPESPMRLLFAAVAALMFLGCLFVLRPFRPAEINLLLGRLPKGWTRLQRLATRLARP